MPRNKSITSIDNRIKKVQEDLFKTKARLDKLTAELRGLEREKKWLFLKCGRKLAFERSLEFPQKSEFLVG